MKKHLLSLVGMIALVAAASSAHAMHGFGGPDHRLADLERRVALLEQQIRGAQARPTWGCVAKSMKGSFEGLGLTRELATAAARNNCGKVLSLVFCDDITCEAIPPAYY